MSTDAAVLALDLVGVAGRDTRDQRLAVIGAACGLAPGEVHDRIWASGFDAECDAGRFTLAAARAEARRLLHADPTDDDLRAWWAAGVAPDRDVLELTDRARSRGVPTALLTNNGPLLLDALEHHELDEIRGRFDRHCFCFRYGVRKPDRGAYAAFAAEVGVPMDTIAFVDDSAANVEGARAAGLRAHQFDGDVAALEAFLAAQGLV